MAFDVKYIIQLIDEFSPNAAKIVKSIRAMDRRMGVFSKKIRKYTKNMRKFGRTLITHVSLPLGFAAFKMIKTAATFDNSMAAIGARSEHSSKKVAILRKRILALSAANVVSANETAKAANTMSRFNISLDDTTKLLDPVMRFAVANAKDGIVQLNDAAGIAIRLGNAYHLTLKQIPAALKMITSANQKADITTEKFYQTMRFSDVILKAHGVSLRESVAITALLGKKGIVSGRAMSQFLTKLIRPTKEVKKMFDSLHITFVKANGDWIGMSKTLEILNKNFKQQKIDEIFTQAGLRVATAALDEGKKGFDAILASTEDSGTQLKLYNAKTKSLQGSIKVLNNSINSLSISLIESKEKALKSIIGGLSSFIGKALGASDATKGLIVDMGGFSAILGPAAVGILGVVTNLAILARVVPGVGIAFRVMWGLVTGPVGIAVGAILLVVTVMTFLYHRFKIVRTAAKLFGHAIKQFISDPVGLVIKQFLLLNKLFDWIAKKFHKTPDIAIRLVPTIDKSALSIVPALPTLDQRAVNIPMRGPSPGALLGPLQQQRVHSTVNINLNDPGGYVNNVQSVSKADDFKVALGDNMAYSR